jgi:hypothetical protein|tara:strand:+ start:6241 stop:6543 length:303 start_codon:yes stop_codon:yes gene_type:complete
MFSPSLIDRNSKQYLVNVLQKCHENRVNVYYYALNLGVLFAFILIFGLALYNCYKNKPTEYEKRQQQLKDQEYILSKIRYHQDVHIQKKTTNITNLPVVT